MYIKGKVQVKLVCHLLQTVSIIYIWLEFFVGPFFQQQMSRNGRYVFGYYKKIKSHISKSCSLLFIHGKRNPHETQCNRFKSTPQNYPFPGAVKKPVHFTFCLVSLQLKIQIKWNQCPLKIIYIVSF